jgi:hypothetical protein
MNLLLHFSHAACASGSIPNLYKMSCRVQNEMLVPVYFTITAGSKVRDYVSIQRDIHFDAWRELTAG